MRNYEIESGIPVPPTKRRSRFGAIRFSEMEIGQSVLLEDFAIAQKKDVTELSRRYRAIYSSIYKLIRAEKPEGKFKVGTVHYRGKTQIRLWRIE